MTDDQLIGILRINDRPDVLYAADRIEAQAKAVRELRAALAEATGQLARLDPKLISLTWYETLLACYPEELGRE